VANVPAWATARVPVGAPGAGRIALALLAAGAAGAGLGVAVPRAAHAQPASAADTARAADALPPGRALALMGHYVGRHAGARAAVDLDEYEGRLYLTPVGGGTRAELRAGPAPGVLTVVPLAAGAPGSAPASTARVTLLSDGRVVVRGDTLRRAPTSGTRAVPIAEPRPPVAAGVDTSLVGEYGADDRPLVVREAHGRLELLPDSTTLTVLAHGSGDAYRVAGDGQYAGEAVVFRRAPGERPNAVTVGGRTFARRAFPADDDRVNAPTPPLRPVAALRREALAAAPPAETGEFRPADLVELRDLDATIRYDIRYATSNNFMGAPFYSSAHAFMQRPAAEAVARASAALRPFGYGLLVHDAYRPWYVTKMFWDGTPPDKHGFVADPAQGSRHNRGAAVDLTLYDRRTGAPVRMTGGYDETTVRSSARYPGGTSRQRWHRDLLRRAMEAQGFTVYDAEWWHFDYKDWRRYPIGTLTFEQLAARGAAGGR
jgi:D-alanyl-D-alanine dipeptidase